MTDEVVVRARVVGMEGTFGGVHAQIRYAIIRLVPAGQDEALLVPAVAAVPFIVAARGRC